VISAGFVIDGGFDGVIDGCVTLGGCTGVVGVCVEVGGGVVGVTVV
jgi:hypothetical protein